MELDEFLAEWENDKKTVLVHTSGSTGKPKPIWVEKQRMLNSARITCDYLGLKPGDTALLCMSLDFIGGKMMVVRSIERNLCLIVERANGHPLSDDSLLMDSRQALIASIDFAAMVPMQVYNSLQVPKERERLSQIKHLIIGGGGIDEALEQELLTMPNAIWSTYGMTETLSHIALRRLNGPEASEWYHPFEGVTVSLDENGCLVIDAPEVCKTPLVTHDIAEISEKGFHIKGRLDNVICSGGIKIQIEEVERVLKAVVNTPFMIAKKKNEKFGEIAILLTESSDLASIEKACREVLPKYWVPKEYIHVESLPLTETGKPKRNIFL